MNLQKRSISFVLILAILMTLCTSFVFGDVEPISVEQVKSGSGDGMLYEYEAAKLSGTIEYQEDIDFIELGLFTSGSGFIDTERIQFSEGEDQRWSFDLTLPASGEYPKGYYFIKILGASDDAYQADVPAFSVTSREIVKQPKASKITTPSGTDYKVKSADGSITIEFTTTAAIATPCSVKTTPLTKDQIKKIMKGNGTDKSKNDEDDEYASSYNYDYFSIGDVEIIDANGNELDVKGAKATFDFDKLLKGASPTDNEYDYSDYGYSIDRDDDDDYLDDEEEDGPDSNLTYTLGFADRFYDFFGNLFLYDEDRDIFYQEDDPDYYYYNPDTYVHSESGESYEDDDEYLDEDDEDYDEDEDDWDEDEDENDIYYSIDGKYYYYYDASWEYDSEMSDGYFYDEYFDVYCFDFKFYYYNQTKNAYFPDTEFEKEFPFYAENIQQIIDTEKAEHADDKYHWDDEKWGNDNTFKYKYRNFKHMTDEAKYSGWYYVEKYDRYALEEGFFKKVGDSYYFDEEFNGYELYKDGNYYFMDTYDNFFRMVESGDVSYMSNPGFEYDYYYDYYDEDDYDSYYIQYKTNKDIISYDGYGTGNKFKIKKNTKLDFLEDKTQKGAGWARILSDEYVKNSSKIKEKLRHNKNLKDKKGYNIDRMGFTQISGITPVFKKSQDVDMLHINDSNKIETISGEMTAENVFEVEDAEFSPIMIAKSDGYSYDAAPSPLGEETGNKDKQNGMGVLGVNSNYDTSDNSSVLVWVMIAVMSLGVFFFTAYQQRKWWVR